MKLPTLKPGERIPRNLLLEEQWLLGLCNAPGTNPNMMHAKRAAIFINWGRGRQQKIAQSLHHIRHWKIIHAPFSLASRWVSGPATWFVDPPYQHEGGVYKAQVGIPYNALGDWCKGLPGQVIVCESDGADWLEFTKFRQHTTGARAGGMKAYNEVWWYRDE